MKKSILVVILALMSCVSAYAREYCDTIVRNGYTQAQYVDAVKRWVVANEDTYGLRIAYANNETGKFIVKGRYRIQAPGLQTVFYDMATPFVSFTINVFCSDDNCIARIAEAKMSFDWMGYVDYDRIPNKYLKECRREIEVLEQCGSIYGTPYDCLNSVYDNKYQAMQQRLRDARNTYNDDNATKKERKDAEKFVRNYAKSGNQAEENVYFTIIYAPFEVNTNLIDGTDRRTLRSIVKNDF